MATQGPTDLTAEQITDLLTESGPEDARTIIPPKQAAAYAHRELLGDSRAETADALGVSVYTVDDRLRRARANVEAVEATARTLTELGVFSDTDDSSTQEPQETATETADDDAANDSPDDTDSTARLWGRLMAIESVSKVERKPGRRRLQVNLTDPTEDDTDTVADLAARLGYDDVANYAPNFGGGDTDVLVFEIGVDGDTDDAPEPRPLTDGLTAAVTPLTEPVGRNPTVEQEPAQHVCKGCGATYSTPSALGGHRSHCDGSDGE